MQHSVLLIGYGNIGKVHARAWRDLGYQVIVWDTDSKAKLRAKGENCFVAEESAPYDETIDFVDICTPNWTHADIISDVQNSFIDRDIRILVEKPGAIRPFDLSPLGNDENVYVMRQNRCKPVYQAIKDNIAQIDPFQIVIQLPWHRPIEYYTESPWHGRRHLDGGSILTHASHYTDLLFWWLGEPEGRGQCLTQQHRLSAEYNADDSGILVYVWPKQRSAAIAYNISTYKQNYDIQISIYGHNGTIIIGGGARGDATYSGGQLVVHNDSEIELPDKQLDKDDLFRAYIDAFIKEDKVVLADIEFEQMLLSNISLMGDK